MNLNGVFWGARIWIWLIFLGAVCVFIGILIYIKREWIRETWLKWRMPEKTIRVVIHHPIGYFTDFWRAIPTETEKILLDGKTYLYDPTRLIINKKGSYPELHFPYNVPVAIDFRRPESVIRYSANETDIYRENDLKRKLVQLAQEKATLMLLMMLGIGNLLASLFVIAKLMGWLK